MNEIFLDTFLDQGLKQMINFTIREINILDLFLVIQTIECGGDIARKTRQLSREKYIIAYNTPSTLFTKTLLYK